MGNKQRLALFLVPLALFLILILVFGKTIVRFMSTGDNARTLESALIGKTMPSFKLQDVYDPSIIHDDKTVFRGKPLLLNVWATWCQTCQAEHAYLNKLASDGIYIVGLNYTDGRDKALAWLKQLGDPYKVSLYDGDGMLGLDLGVYGAPETYLIDSKGVIQHRHVGDINERVWQQKLKPLFERMH